MIISFKGLKSKYSMKIKYILSDDDNYVIKKDFEKGSSDLSFLLTNKNGDSFGQNISSNESIGLNIVDEKNKNNIKILNSINIINKECSDVCNDGCSIKRTFKDRTKDEFFLSPTGGLLYKIKSENAIINIEIENSGKTNIKNNVLIFKKGDIFIGISSLSGQTELINSNLKINGVEEIIISYGSDEEEMLERLNILESHKNDLKEIRKDFFKELIDNSIFEKPLSESIRFSYCFSQNNVFDLINNENKFSIEKIISLRTLIDSKEYMQIKQSLYDYLSFVDAKLNIIKTDKYNSYDFNSNIIFWMAKRFEDLIFKLENEKLLNNIFSTGELRLLYNRFYLVFGSLIETSWDEKEELLSLNNFTSIINEKKEIASVESQVGLLELVSFLNVLNTIIQKDKNKNDKINEKDNSTNLLNFENLLKSKIIDVYFKDDILFSNIKKNKESVIVFVIYYLYPELFSKDVWKNIFMRSLDILSNEFGIFSSKQTRSETLFWINDLIAICLNDLDKDLYKSEIRDILNISSSEILNTNTIGYSRKKIDNYDEPTCLLSTAMYIEMINKIFNKN